MTYATFTWENIQISKILELILPIRSTNQTVIESNKICLTTLKYLFVRLIFSCVILFALIDEELNNLKIQFILIVVLYFLLLCLQTLVISTVSYVYCFCNFRKKYYKIVINYQYFLLISLIILVTWYSHFAPGQLAQYQNLEQV